LGLNWRFLFDWARGVGPFGALGLEALEFFEGPEDGPFETGVVTPEVGEHAGAGVIVVNGVGHFGVWCDNVVAFVEGGGEFADPVIVEAYFGGLQSATAPEGDYDCVYQHLFGWRFGLVFGMEGGAQGVVLGYVFSGEDDVLCIHA
jgi:hypothetical protein